MPPLGKKGSVFPARSKGVFGCENCREQHLKCDRVTPVCGRCQKAGRECRRTGLRVREPEAKYTNYAKTQKWVKTPRRILFINETDFSGDTVNASPESGPEDYLELDLSGSPDTLADEPSRRSSLHSPIHSSTTGPASPYGLKDPYHARASFVAEESYVATNHHVPAKRRNNEDQYGPKDPYSSKDRYCPPPKGQSPSDRFFPPSVHLPATMLPLNDPEQAQLLRHFTQNLSIWLDLCDPQQSFQTIVPQQAGRCPILLNAILALSGRHLAHVNKDFPHDAYRKYSRECVGLLKNYHDHRENLVEEDIFAATVIMRVLAEMEAKDSGQFNTYFLAGLSLFVQHQGTYLNRDTQDSLGAAAFWVGLRQEIYFAVANSKQVGMLNMNNLPGIVDQQLTPADDYTWANRAVVHCAEVLNWCFAPPHEKAPHRWDELVNWNSQWLDKTSSSYTAMYTDKSDVPFPEIWYIKGCHVIGTQHHLLAKLFLISHNPALRSVGIAGHSDKVKIQPEQQDIVRKICGIALGNPWTPPSMFTACMAIHAFGDLFSERTYQEAMMAILQRAEHEHGRPTETVQKDMVTKMWHWEQIPEHLLTPDVKAEPEGSSSPKGRCWAGAGASGTG